MASHATGKDPLLFNKVSAAILLPCLFVVVLNIGAGAIFSPSKPKVAGYDLPAAEEASAAGAGAGAAQAAVAPIAERLAKADPAKGENVAKQCLTCHSLKADGSGSKTGPNLFGVFEREMASADFPSYSAALKGHKGQKWDAEQLDKFIANPKAAMPGTTMTFNGLGNPDRRAELIAYLAKLK